MKLINLDASGGPFQTKGQGENTAKRNLNNIMKLTITKTDIFENVVTVD